MQVVIFIFVLIFRATSSFGQRFGGTTAGEAKRRVMQPSFLARWYYPSFIDKIPECCADQKTNDVPLR